MGVDDVRELGAAGQRVAAQCGDDMMPPAAVRVGEGGWALPTNFLRYREAIRNMEVRPSDVWILSFPKNGTTWTQEMVWIAANDCDLDAAKSSPLHLRSPFLDFTALGIPKRDAFVDTVEIISNLPRDTPRIIKSHLPLELLPKDLLRVGPKIIYVSRDPRDTLISYYHHYRIINSYNGNLDDFLDAMIADAVLFGPFWEHVLQYWELSKQQPQFLYLTFEEMKKDLRSVLRRTAAFLGKAVPQDKEESVLAHLSFQSMKVNPMVNLEEFVKPKTEEDSFIRKGEAGGWKKRLSAEQIVRMNEWCNKWLQGKAYPHFVA